MTRIELSGDCDNSPKNKLLQDLTVAIARNDLERIAQIVTEDVDWVPIGRKSVTGVSSLCQRISRVGPATRLTIDRVMSHGKSGAVNGEVTYRKSNRAFCFVFEFANAKGQAVKRITSYYITIT